MRRSWLLPCLWLAACTPPENATRDTARSTANPTAQAGPGSATASASATVPASASAAAPPTASAAVTSVPSAAPTVDEKSAIFLGEAVTEPELVDAEGHPLPQLDDQPADDSRLFALHRDQLLRAIVADDATIAEHVFFPKIAYEQVKAIEKPGLDWKNRLWKAFVRDVHEYHQELGADPAAATFVAIEVTGKKEWMKPGAEGNKIGYWRTKRAHLRVKDARGKEHAFEVTSMISWRGEWYVVHLHGFE